MTSVLPAHSRTVPGPDGIDLGEPALPGLAGRLRVPGYDRSALTPGIVHVGVGGFHRAHQACYLDDLARTGETGWGEVGVGLHSPAMKAALLPQDCLFTVVERDERSDTARVVGSMLRYLYAPDDPAAVLAVLTDERTRVVTLTITGSGYPVGEDGVFDAGAPGVRADLRYPDHPRTVFGYLVEALDRRRRRGLPAFTVLSCDNVPGNGAVTRAAVLGVAAARGPGRDGKELARWIEEHASFPASMVDRITPGTDAQARDLVAARFGVRDRSPVITEPFTQWVIEDDFCNGRPPLDRVGVQFVADVTPYQLMKTRLLNASHSALGYLGYLIGRYETSSDAMANPIVADYLAALMRQEIRTLLPEVPGVDLDAYQRTLLSRFANPRISDQLSRLCGRGSTKMPAYLLPSLEAARANGRRTALLTLAVAGWCRYLCGYDLSGNPIEIKDARLDVLQPLAVERGADPRPLLRERAIFGRLGDDPEFVRSLEAAIRDIEEYGPAAIIAEQLSLQTRPGTAGTVLAPAGEHPVARSESLEAS
jgi:mannitol 2-dehydrogenase